MVNDGSNGNESNAEVELNNNQSQKRVIKRKRTESGLANPRKKRTSNVADKKYLPVGQIPSIAMCPPFNALGIPLKTGTLYPESVVLPQGNASLPACAPDCDPNVFQEAMRGLQAIAKEQLRKPFVSGKPLELQIEQEIWNTACQEKIHSSFSLEGILSSRLPKTFLQTLYKSSDIPRDLIKRYRSLVGTQ